MKHNKKIINVLLGSLLLIYSNVLLAQASTGPNKVYIEQVGSTNTLTIEQVGGTNNVGGVTNTTPTAVDASGITTLTPAAPSATNYGLISGSNNILNITQTGDTNSAQYSIRGSSNQYTSAISGDGNQTSLTIGDLVNNANLRNVITETVTGDNNTIIQQLVGNDITSNTTITGSNNQVTSYQLSSNGYKLNTIVGNHNVFNIQQSDSAGANGHHLTMNTTGDYNSTTIQQQGFNDTTVNVLTTGSHNTITIRTSSAAIVNPGIAIAR